LRFGGGNFAIRYLQALGLWLVVLLAGSLYDWVTAKPEDNLTPPGPFDNFMPIEDPGLFLLWCLTLVPATAVLIRRNDPNRKFSE
jgi:hypothetical protein